MRIFYFWEKLRVAKFVRHLCRGETEFTHGNRRDLSHTF